MNLWSKCTAVALCAIAITATGCQGGSGGGSTGDAAKSGGAAGLAAAVAMTRSYWGGIALDRAVVLATASVAARPTLAGTDSRRITPDTRLLLYSFVPPAVKRRILAPRTAPLACT